MKNIMMTANKNWISESCNVNYNDKFEHCRLI